MKILIILRIIYFACVSFEWLHRNNFHILSTTSDTFLCIQTDENFFVELRTLGSGMSDRRFYCGSKVQRDVHTNIMYNLQRM